MTYEQRTPDGYAPDADRWIEALLGARLAFQAQDGEGLRYWGRVYKRWSQLYHRTFDPATYAAREEWTCPSCGERELDYMVASHECFDSRIERERASFGVAGSL